MGGGNWSHDAYTANTSERATKSKEQTFTARGLDPEMDPRKVKNGVRESRDSANHPFSKGCIFGLDQTGSMGGIPDHLSKGNLGSLMKLLIDHQFLPDAQGLMAGIGDAQNDEVEIAPLQVGQFESDLLMDTWLTKIFLEGKGGRNPGETYLLLDYWVAKHTSMDCWEKRHEKGYLFTIGDEPPLMTVTADEIERYIGDKVDRDFSAQEVIAMSCETFHRFHVIIEEGSAGRSQRTHSTWKQLLADHVLPLSDYRVVSELMACAIGLTEGTLHPDNVEEELNTFGLNKTQIKAILRALDAYITTLRENPVQKAEGKVEVAFVDVGSVERLS